MMFMNTIFLQCLQFVHKIMGFIENFLLKFNIDDGILLIDL